MRSLQSLMLFQATLVSLGLLTVGCDLLATGERTQHTFSSSALRGLPFFSSPRTQRRWLANCSLKAQQADDTLALTETPTLHSLTHLDGLKEGLPIQCGFALKGNS